LSRSGAGTATVGAVLGIEETAVRSNGLEICRRGLLKLSWPVLEAGAGVRGFKVRVRPIGVPGGWATRAHGTTANEATVRLGRGRSFLVLAGGDRIGEVLVAGPMVERGDNGGFHN
jgi:hypothetical protein